MTGMLRQSGSGITGPPAKFRQNETPIWQDGPHTDEFDTQYDSSVYTLTYVFVGASLAPISVVATPAPIGLSGNGWITQPTPAKSALFLPGAYWWQAVLTGTPAGATFQNRLVAAEGELTVEADFATITGTFDGRSTLQIALANAETALTVFQASGGRVKAYNIAGRQMTFQDDREIIALVTYLQGRVEAEKQKATGGDRRNIRVGFRPAAAGSPGVPFYGWPWF